MLLVDPKNVVFESRTDIVDYVAKGIPPRKKDFNKVMEAIHQQGEDVDGVSIPSDIFIVDAEEFESVLRRIYEVNCRKRNLIIAGIGIAAALFVGSKIVSHAKEKKELAEIDAEIDRWIDEHPEVKVDRF